MPATATSIAPRSASETGGTPRRLRRPFRDNPRLILAGIGVLVVVLIALLVIARGSSRLSPDFLSEFVLYALSAADLTMLLALLFVLARNIVKLVVERRYAEGDLIINLQTMRLIGLPVPQSVLLRATELIQ